MPPPALHQPSEVRDCAGTPAELLRGRGDRLLGPLLPSYGAVVPLFHKYLKQDL